MLHRAAVRAPGCWYRDSGAAIAPLTGQQNQFAKHRQALGVVQLLLNRLRVFLQFLVSSF